MEGVWKKEAQESKDFSLFSKKINFIKKALDVTPHPTIRLDQDATHLNNKGFYNKIDQVNSSRK